MKKIFIYKKPAICLRQTAGVVVSDELQCSDITSFYINNNTLKHKYCQNVMAHKRHHVLTKGNEYEEDFSLRDYREGCSMVTFRPGIWESSKEDSKNGAVSLGVSFTELWTALMGY